MVTKDILWGILPKQKPGLVLNLLRFFLSCQAPDIMVLAPCALLLVGRLLCIAGRR